jgi:citrate lyase subunit beta/citryl-CoA lyase
MIRPIQSLLFAPANRLDLIGKFGRVAADAFVLDLEDGTPAAEREGARATLAQALRDAAEAVGDRAEIMVRVNAADTSDFIADCEAVRAAGCGLVVLSKAERAEQVRRTADLCSAQVLAGIESVAGVGAAESIAATPGVFAVFFGAEDYVADLGGVRTRESLEVLYPRSRVAMAARLAGVQALDQVTVDLKDNALFNADAAMGRSLGYTGKMCLTPAQVELANAAWRPTAEAVADAEALVAAYDLATAAGQGTIAYQGRMIDGPLLKQAQAIIAAGRR